MLEKVDDLHTCSMMRTRIKIPENNAELNWLDGWMDGLGLKDCGSRRPLEAQFIMMCDG